LDPKTQAPEKLLPVLKQYPPDQMEFCPVSREVNSPAVDKASNIERLARVAITPELETLLRDMQGRATSGLLFPSPHDPSKPRQKAKVNRRIAAACVESGVRCRSADT
jgi:hypothetical protein